MARPLRPTPARMLNVVLDFLERTPEWSSQTWNDLAWLLTEGGYATTDKNGSFKAKKCADVEQVDMYARGWEAGRRAALVEIAEGVVRA